MPLSPDRLRDALTGVIGFPITPFRPDLSVDLDALRQNVRMMLEHPLAAIVAAGGTGELYSLTPGEHLDVVAAIVEEAHGKLP
jgi:5-dehydro-4-deoxyglucarate dehydratase